MRRGSNFVTPIRQFRATARAYQISNIINRMRVFLFVISGVYQSSNIFIPRELFCIIAHPHPPPNSPPPKLLVGYRPSCVSEIEYYHPLDAVLFLVGSFDHSPAYSGSSMIESAR